MYKSFSLRCSVDGGWGSAVQGRIEPPKAASGHATSNSANIDSIVLNVTKNRDPRAACKTTHTVEVLIFYTLSLSASMVWVDLP